jgi:superfamily II DNA or RNA helicase
MSNQIVLRTYQYRDADKIRQSYRSGHKAPLYVAPCGSGKTVLFAYVALMAAKLGNRVVILCHRTELVDQISDALTAQEVPHSYIASGYRYSAGYAVYVASVFTLARRLDLVNPDLIIVDEAHHSSLSTTWGAILQAYPKARRLGVTATPCRTSGEGLDCLFDDLIMGPTDEELVDGGYLTRLQLYAPPLIDSSGLHTRAGEFVQSEVVERADKAKVTGDCIEHYRRLAPGRRAIVFDVSIDAARRRATAFREAGFRSECIDGTLAREVRAMAISDFRSGRVQVLTSCDLVSEGFDLPAVEVGISLRPTQSLQVWRQQGGRIRRPMEGKSVSLFFDHTGNWERHGLPHEPRVWSLSGDVKSVERDKPELSPRICPACLAVSPGHAKKCVACGEAFPIKSRVVREKEGTLKALTQKEIEAKREARDRKQAQGRAVTRSDLMELYFVRHGHDDIAKAGRWADHVLNGRRAKGKGYG